MRNVIPSIALISLLLAFSMPAQAANSNHDQLGPIGRQISNRIKGLHITAVHKTPFKGVYEVDVGRRIFYSNAQGTYLIAGGQMFNTITHADITATRLDELHHVNWNQLPLNQAIVSGDPNGKPLVIFTDPDCPFCRRLEKNIQHIKGIKLYTLLFPLTRIHPHALQHAKAIWCSKHRHTELLNVMLHNANPPAGSCNESGILEIMTVAQKLGIHGTPTLVAKDGRLHSGYMSPKSIIAWLNLKTQAKK